MITNARRTLTAMLAAASMALLLSSPLHAQATGTVSQSGPSASQDPCTVRTMEELQNAVCQLLTRVNDLETQLSQAQGDLLDAQGEIVTLQASLATAKDDIAHLQFDLTTAEGRIDVLEANPVLELGPYVSVDVSNLEGLVGPHVLFTGANVHVRSGSGATDDGGALTGLGNLIVGYNESNSDVRTGSHNLVIGRRHTYTSFGGLVAGFNNVVTGQESSVTAGKNNTASGLRSSISGGESGIASGQHASITAGNENIASGINSSVTGGIENQAMSPGSATTGGRGNIAGTDSTVGFYSVVSGGNNRTAPENNDWAAGSLFENN